MEQYDEIAEAYVKGHEDKISRNYLITPSFMGSLGDMKGKDVLDLACGNGYFTRRIRLAGARRVVGADISGKMIGLAEGEERKNPLGIEYLTKDVSALGKIGEFDLVCAAFLLHYSDTKEKLSLMCKSAYENLREGGRFITLNINPGNPLTSEKKYGAVIRCDELREGAELKTTLFSNGEEYCSFTNYHWSRETYEQSLGKAGFSAIEWVPMEASGEGIARLGKRFWEAYYRNPYLIIIKAAK
jgi:2-polyprenyl-3-methyl-5-hydroxy-6-metoxy-1,4-benzoquinol methylase